MAPILGLCVLGSLFPGVSIAKDIYLAVRQDGRKGSGSAQDPFDASSAAKYDAILARFREDANFFYSPGIYETTGGRYRIRPTANPHCHHFGAGVARTIIRLVGASHPTEEGTIFYADYDSTVEGFELHDLRLDCNAPGNPKFRDGAGAVSAVNVVGNNMSFSNLKVVHFGTGKRGVECFPLFCYAGAGHTGGQYENIRLENSVFTEPATGNKDGLGCAVIAASADARLEGAIVNCRFINLKSDFSYSHACGAALCEGNEVIGCETGFYLEPDDQQSGTWIIRKNRFRDVIAAAMVKWHPTGSLNTIQFEDNDVVLRVDPQQTSVACAVDDTGLKPGDQRPTIAKVIFRNNRIRLADPSKEPVARAAGLHLVSLEARYSVGEVVLENNLFSLPPGREMIISPSPVVRSFFQHGNVDSSKGEVRVRDVHGNPINPL
ncbi:MAG: hypothetical protein JO151_18975 [Verrucomicrobia bacterium]|nr:hypothetical protein [Verrucomicrobiota bacterium]